ncbi:sensor histidine kinase [Kribbella sp. CWNU-51]
MVPWIEGIDVRLRFVAAVLLVIAVIAGAFAVTRIESLRDGVLVLAGGLALAAVVGVLALTRARQRQAMPEVERYFRLAPEMVILAGFDGYWKRVNPTVGAVLGYTEREALARPFMEFVHPDDRARSEEQARRVMGGATAVSFENRIVCKDGSYKWIEWTVTPVPEERVMYGIGRDVTERRRSEWEQVALQRIATLVAQEAPEANVFDAIAEEVGRLLGAEEIRMLRFDSGTSAVIVGSSGRADAFPVGSQQHLEGESVALRVLRTGRPARFDDYRAAAGQDAETARSIGVRAVVGVPVVVEGRLWGAISAGSTHEAPLPPDSEARLDKFTKLMATAIANAEARAEVHRLADEQAALRRVATLVAQGASPQDLFEAVAEEVGCLLPAGGATMGRFEPDGSVTTVASWSTTEAAFPAGRRWPTEGTNVAWMVLQTGRAARLDDFSAATDPIGNAAQEAGIKSAVGSPVVVKGYLWGVMTATSTEGPMPPGTEARLASFTELVATAIANAEGKSELAASRRRIVAASDETRRRIERNLHDGTQQRLVSLGLAVRAAEADLPPERDDLRARLSDVATGLAAAVEDLREISRGIHPAILSVGGLGPALRSLARRSVIPVDLKIMIDVRVAEPIEVAAYFVASEALANAAKHSQASRIDVSLEQRDQSLLLSVRDDGVGGADTARGSGLVGLMDRVEALGGSIRVDSRPGNGTQITAELPPPVG